MTNLLESLRKYLLLPSSKEWANMSLLNKITVVGFWVGILGLLIGLIPLLITPTTYADMEEKLGRSVQAKDWPRVSSLLSEAKKHSEMADLYYFYGGVLALRAYGNTTPPHEYFEKIHSGSPYYLKGQALIYAEAATGKWLSAPNQASSRIVENLTRVGIRAPLYYFSLLDANKAVTYKWLKETYSTMSGDLREYMDFQSFNNSIQLRKGEWVSYSLDQHLQTRAVALTYLSIMTMAAKNERDTLNCLDAKKKLSKLVELAGMESIEKGMKLFSHDTATKLYATASSITCN